jgi:adenylate cyclase
MPLLSKKRLEKRIQIGMGVICTVIFLLLNTFHVPFVSSTIERFNHLIYDSILQLNWHHYKTDARVIIIDIDELSVKKEGRWPWPRDKMALLLTKLQQSGVVVTVMDMVMSEAETNEAVDLNLKVSQLNNISSKEKQELTESLTELAPQLDNNKILAQALHAGDTVLGFLFHYDSSVQKGVLPSPLNMSNGQPMSADAFNAYPFKGFNGILDVFIDAAGHGGFVTNIPDSDGIIRNALLLARFDDKIYPSLALATVMRYLLVDSISLKTEQREGTPVLEGIDLGGIFIPTNTHGEIVIPFLGPPGTIDYYSATDVMHDQINRHDLEGAIAIIGSSMILLADLHPSPITPLFPGVEIVANLVLGMINQQIPIYYNWNTLQGQTIPLLLGVLLSFIYPRRDIVFMIVFTSLLFLFILTGTVYLFVFKQIFTPPSLLLTLISAIACINYGYEFYMVRKQKKKISQLFGQYVPEQYVKELIESPENYTMEGQTRVMTVLFSDIRNFTGISEDLDAGEVKRLLNTFFTEITEIIFSFQGTIDKYVGDMIMAFWGAPIPDEIHTHHAISASLTIFKKLPDINAKMSGAGLPMLQIGIGLATGSMNVGDMGSEFRRSYTVLGDTVNLASRLQDLTKFYQVNILVTEATRAGQDDFLWRKIDEVFVKGHKHISAMYQPICLMNEATPELLAELALYEQALLSYSKQQWDAAELDFQKLVANYMPNHLYQLYLSKVKGFRKTPPLKPGDICLWTYQ